MAAWDVVVTNVMMAWLWSGENHDFGPPPPPPPPHPHHHHYSHASSLVQ